jgi:hypothetical protein
MTTTEPEAPQHPLVEEPEFTFDEEPELTFWRYAIAFHLAARWCGDDRPALRGGTHLERAMESYEDDMLLYAHRDEAPFRTRVVPTEIEAVTVRFARELTYEAEGRRKRLRCADATEAGRTRNFGVALGQTLFERSELAILSFVLTPLEPPAEDFVLNEYDVIKLVKLWEGGEGVGDAASSLTEGRDVWFATVPGERRTLHHLAALAFPGWQPLGYEHVGCEEDIATTARSGYRVGTVELELPPSEWRHDLFRDLATLKRRREAPSSDGKRWDRAVAVGGILQGLLDFRQIEDYELADVFADVEVDPEDETMRAFHKGTLLSLSAEAEPEDDDEERPSPIGVDPYLAVPNIVLLHDEQRLKTARLRERNLSLRQRGPLRGWRYRAAIHETENGLSEMAGLLAQHLPNVFHYSSERRLQKRGRQSRGLDDLEAFMRLRMDDLSSVLQSRVRRRDRWTAVIGIAVGVVTAFLVQQAIEGRPLWLIVLAGAVLFGVFLWLRDRLF